MERIAQPSSRDFWSRPKRTTPPRSTAALDMSESGRTLLPVTVVKGFLGSGKTTLLRSLLQGPELAQCAALINQIGEVGFDHHLVRDVREDPIVLPNGCLCCTVRSDPVRLVTWPDRDRDSVLVFVV